MSQSLQYTCHYTIRINIVKNIFIYVNAYGIYYNQVMKLTVNNLNFAYQDGEQEKIIFENVNVQFAGGQVHVILGASGSGKSTLLALLGTVDKPQSGSIKLDGQDIFARDTEYRKHHIGFVFQNYNLIEDLNGMENIEMALAIADNMKVKDTILGVLNLVGIDEATAKKRVNKLSGGEQQRIAIARAFINNPDIILADEPTGNLDPDTSLIIMNIFLRLAHEYDKCIILVTHNQDLAKMGDCIYTVKNHSILKGE